MKTKEDFAKWLGNARQLSGDHRCRHWLTGEMKNGHWDCPAGRDFFGRVRFRWFDHGTVWITEDNQRVAVGQPYQIEEDDIKELAELVSEGCSVSILDESWGWYGLGTVVVIVRSKA